MAGRPLKVIDKEKFEELCELQCSMKEICQTLDVSDKTLSAWVKRTYGKKYFSEVFEQKRKRGFYRLRSAQYALALSGNTTMQIWLGRNWLGQTDKIVTSDTEEDIQEKIEDTDSFKQQYADVRDNLYKQLEKRKAITPIYKDLIEDYMSFWSIKESLKKDIKERGVYIKYNNGGGQSGETDNPSIEKLLKISTKMKDILLQLEIDLDAVGEDDDEL